VKTPYEVFALAAAFVMFALPAPAADAYQRPMVVHKLAELGLEIWTEGNPVWDTELGRQPGEPRPIFSAETPGQAYPPAGMTWAVPGISAQAEELPQVARGALRQAARNYGLGDDVIRSIALKPAKYGELQGFEAEFPAVADDVPVDVRVFFGHQPGKPLVAMQVFTLRGKLRHLSEQIRRSWGNVRYLPSH
jgi:hypothetical protein